MITNFKFDMPTRVLFGPGSLKKLHTEKLPGRKALVVISAGGSMKRHGQLDAVLAELAQADIDHVMYEGIRPNPTDTSVDEAAKLARETGCDLVVALGGGSTMDASKVIALMATNEGSCWDYSPSGTGGKKKFAKEGLPLVCITTSAGTGSEVDIWSVISNDATGEKTGYPSRFPTLSVVDPEMMMTVPPHLTACQGMDTFFHAAESVINTKEHVVGEMFALKAIELVAKYLPRAVKDGSDKEARSNMAIANTLAGYYMLCTSEHTLEHALGSNHPKLTHGAGLVMLSHEYFGFFADRKACEEQMVKMAKAMGRADATSGADFISALDTLIAEIGLGTLKMSEHGITADELPTVAKLYHQVYGGDTTADPLKLSDDDVLGILQRAYR